MSKTKYIILTSLFLIGLQLLTGCGTRGSIRKEYVRFMHSRITFPEELIKIEDGVQERVHYERSGRPLLIHYYGPDECSSCAVSHMQNDIKYLTMAQREGKFDFIVVMAPPEEDRDMVIRKAQEMALPLSIYIDDTYHFQSLEVIPPYPIMHYFLLGEKGSPIFIGPPFYDEKTRAQFLRRLGK